MGRVKREPLECRRRPPSQPSPGPAAKVARLQEGGRAWEEWPNQQDLHLSFVPLAEEAVEETTTEQLIPAMQIAVSDILPLTLSSGQVSLGLDPTSSSLPISPIFIRSGEQVVGGRLSPSLLEAGQSCLLDSLEEITSLPTELLSLGISLTYMQGKENIQSTEGILYMNSSFKAKLKNKKSQRKRVY